MLFLYRFLNSFVSFVILLFMYVNVAHFLLLLSVSYTHLDVYKRQVVSVDLEKDSAPCTKV